MIGLEKKQNLIDILIELSLNNSDSSSFSNQLVGNLFTFLARQIANKTNNIQVDDLIFSQVNINTKRKYAAQIRNNSHSNLV